MSADERRVEEIIRHVERMRGSTWVSEDKQLMDECAWMDKAIRDLLAHIGALTARLAEAHAALADAPDMTCGSPEAQAWREKWKLTPPPTPGGQGTE